MSSKNTKAKIKAKTPTTAVRADSKNIPPKARTTGTPEVIEVIEVAAVETTDTEMSALLAEMDEAAIDVSLLEAEAVETVEAIDRTEVYAAMESDLSVGDTEVEGTAPKSGSKAKAKRATTKVATDAQPRRTVDIERLTTLVGTEEAGRIMTSSAALPVKIRDKAINAVAAITSGGRMSGYTSYAIEHLRKAEGQETTSKGMIDMFLERGYTKGTAQAQAQQQMVLLDFMGVAERNGRSLKLRADAPLLAAIAA